ncbi:MAG: hypothetical protein N2D54_13315 [Chloroflexota bacterium]
MLDDFDLDVPEDEEPFEEESEESSGGSNRNFMVVAGSLGGLIIISMICIALYTFVILPNRDQRTPAQKTLEVQQTALSQSLTETSQAVAVLPPTETETPRPTNTQRPPTETQEATETPLATAADATADASVPTVHPMTATVWAVLTNASLGLTQAANSLLTTTPTVTATALPNTGFLDDYGPIGLLMVTTLMILVIFMARRLRQANI